MVRTSHPDHIFINCPYDRRYTKIFRAIIFTVTHCGFYVRCALEESDSGRNRLSKIQDIISQCRYSINDISRTEIDPVSLLPRFNMPLELGIFFGAKRYGSPSQQTKQCLILDTEHDRYRKFISDISGHDIEYYHGDIKTVMSCVRNWLANKAKQKRLCSGSIIYEDYQKFLKELPSLCARNRLDINELIFFDFNSLVNTWIVDNTKKIPEPVLK